MQAFGGSALNKKFNDDNEKQIEQSSKHQHLSQQS